MTTTEHSRTDLEAHLRTQRFVILGLFVVVLALCVVLFAQTSDPTESASTASVPPGASVSPSPTVSLSSLISERTSDLQYAVTHIEEVSPEYSNLELGMKWGSIIRVKDAMMVIQIIELLEKMDPASGRRLLAEQLAWQEYADAESDKSYAEYEGGTFAPISACHRYNELVDERLGVLSAVQGSS